MKALEVVLLLLHAVLRVLGARLEERRGGRRATAGADGGGSSVQLIVRAGSVRRSGLDGQSRRRWGERTKGFVRREGVTIGGLDGFVLVTIVVVVEIFTTDGINFSAKSANEAGASFATA